MAGKKAEATQLQAVLYTLMPGRCVLGCPDALQHPQCFSFNVS